MLKSDHFNDGWNYILNHSSLFVGQKYNSESLLQQKELIDEINKFVISLNNHKNIKTDIEQLKGFVAEEFHTHTFNINSILMKSKSRAFCLKSNDVGSVDVQVVTENGVSIPFSLKYCSTGSKSAISQSINLIEKYKQYEHSALNPLSMEEYFQKNGWSLENAYSSLYLDQGRVIPSDQISDAIDYIEKRIKRNIGKEGIGRKIDISRWKNTLEKLSPVIKDDKNVSSIELTKEDSKILAELSKKGVINTKIIQEKCGINVIMELYKITFNESIKAGVSTGLIHLVFSIVPEIYKIIEYLINAGELDIDDLKELGQNSIKAYSKGFLYGAISCTMIHLINIKNIIKFNSSINGVLPSIVGAMSTIILNVIFNMFNATKGRINYKDVGTSFVEELIIMGASVGCGMLGQIVLSALPAVGYFIGSFIGSTLAGFSINVSKKIVLELCVSTGFTCFGLVKQDYTLPEDYLRELGIDIIKLDKVELEIAELERAPIEVAQLEYADIETIDIKILKRGVIEVNKIGYLQ